MPVEEKKDGSSTGLTTYTYSLMIGRNTYGGTINPTEFSERLGKTKQFLERKYDGEGDENNLSESRQTE